jgi:Copper chaperone PCu(A)C/NnrS protein
MTKICRSDIYPTLAAIVAFFLAQLLAFAAMATDYDVDSIHIAQPWSRATPKGAKTGAGYMTITNKGKTPDKVSCLSDDASTQCEIHSMTAMLVASLARIAAPLLPTIYYQTLLVAAACWLLAFGVFLLIYGPMLLGAKRTS